MAKKLDHSKAVDWANKVRETEDQQCNFVLRYENEYMYYNNAVCFGDMSTVHVDGLVGIYVYINSPDRKTLDFDEGGPSVNMPDTSRVVDEYLRFVLHPSKSPWRKVIGRRTVFRNDDGRIYMVYLPIERTTNTKFLINAMAAIRAVWYNFGSVHTWYEGVKRGLDPYDSLYASMFFTIKGTDIRFRKSSGHFFHDPQHNVSIEDLKKGTPSNLDKPSKWRDFNMHGYSSVWRKLGNKPTIKELIKGDPIVYIGAFKRLQARAKQNMPDVQNVDLDKVFSTLKETREKWAA